MKRKKAVILLFVLFPLVSLPCKAQFGIIAQYSNLNGAGDLYQGIKLGIDADLKLSKHFYINIGAQYNALTGKAEERRIEASAYDNLKYSLKLDPTTWQNKASSFEVPLTFKLSFPIAPKDAVKLYGFVGGSFVINGYKSVLKYEGRVWPKEYLDKGADKGGLYYGISSSGKITRNNIKGEFDKTDDLSVLIESYYADKILPTMSKYDARIVAGVGFTFNTFFDLFFTYEYGFINQCTANNGTTWHANNFNIGLRFDIPRCVKYKNHNF